MPNEQNNEAVRDFLAAGLEEVSPPGGITHRQGRPFMSHHRCADPARAEQFMAELVIQGATDVQLGADRHTVWWANPSPDRLIVPKEHMAAAQDALNAAQDQAGARALKQAMDDLLEYARATDNRCQGAYEPARFAQEIVGLGRVVDAQLETLRLHRMEQPGDVLSARAMMYLFQADMEEHAGLCRDAESLFYDIQAHTEAIEYQAKANLIGSANPLGSGKGDKVAAHSETSAAKVMYVEDEACKRHGTLVRMAGRVKARATDLYGISRRRLRTAQKAVDTFTGKSDDE